MWAKIWVDAQNKHKILRIVYDLSKQAETPTQKGVHGDMSAEITYSSMPRWRYTLIIITSQLIETLGLYQPVLYIYIYVCMDWDMQNILSLGFLSPVWFPIFIYKLFELPIV